jgi:hypothetical protein
MVDAARILTNTDQKVAIKDNIQLSELLEEVLLKLRSRFSFGDDVPRDERVEIKAQTFARSYRQDLRDDQLFVIDINERRRAFLEHAYPSPSVSLKLNLRDVRELLLSIHHQLRQRYLSELQKNWSRWREEFGTELDEKELPLEKYRLEELIETLIEAAQEILSLSGEDNSEATSENIELPKWLEEVIDETKTAEGLVHGWNTTVREIVTTLLQFPSQTTLQEVRLVSNGESVKLNVLWLFLNEWLDRVYERNFGLTPPVRPNYKFEVSPAVVLRSEDLNQLQFFTDKIKPWLRELRDLLDLKEKLSEEVINERTENSTETPASPIAKAQTGGEATTTSNSSDSATSASTITSPESPSLNTSRQQVSPPQTRQELVELYQAQGSNYNRELLRYQEALLPTLLLANGFDLSKGQLSLAALKQQYPDQYQDLVYWFSTEIEHELFQVFAENPDQLTSYEGRLSIMTKLQRRLLLSPMPQLTTNIEQLRQAIPSAQTQGFSNDESQVDQYLANHPVTAPDDAFLNKASFLVKIDDTQFVQYLKEIGITGSDQEQALRKLTEYLASGQYSSRLLVFDQADFEQLLGVSLPPNLNVEQLEYLRHTISSIATSMGESASSRIGYDSLHRPSRASFSQATQKLTSDEQQQLSIVAELSAGIENDFLMAASAASNEELRQMGIYNTQMEILRQAMLEQRQQELLELVNRMRLQQASQAEIDAAIDQENQTQAKALEVIGPRDQDGYVSDSIGRRIPSLKTLRSAKKALNYAKKGVDIAAKAADSLVTGLALASGVAAPYAMIPEPLRKYLSLGIIGGLAALIAKLSQLLGGLGGSVLAGAGGGTIIGGLIGGPVGAVAGGLIGGIGGGIAHLLGQSRGGVGGINLLGGGVPGSNPGPFGGPVITTATPTPVISTPFAGMFSATQVVGGSVAAFATAAVIITNQAGAFLPPENFSDNLSDISKYVTISKTATPSRLENDQKADVSYKITITPKENYSIEITDLKDEFSYLGGDPLSLANPSLDFKAKAPGKISKDNPVTFEYTVPMQGKDVLVVNTVTLKFIAYQGDNTLTQNEDEKAQMTAQVRIGNPKVGCFEFVDGSGEAFYNKDSLTKAWLEEEKNKVLNAYSVRAGTNPFFNNLICSKGKIKLYRLIGYSFGGFAPGAAGGEKLGLYDGAFGNGTIFYGPGSIEYTLIHELGHIADYRNPGLRSDFLKVWSGSCYTYPAGATNPCTGPEAFAEGNALYVVSSTYPQVGNFGFKTKPTYSNEYNFYKEKMYNRQVF